MTELPSFLKVLPTPASFKGHPYLAWLEKANPEAYRQLTEQTKELRTLRSMNVMLECNKRRLPTASLARIQSERGRVIAKMWHHHAAYYRLTGGTPPTPGGQRLSGREEMMTGKSENVLAGQAAPRVREPSALIVGESLPTLSLLPDHPAGGGNRDEWARIVDETGRKLLRQSEASRRLRRSIDGLLSYNEENLSVRTIRHLTLTRYITRKRLDCLHLKVCRALGRREDHGDIRNPNISLVEREGE
ncbi:MAG: hypothetical protein ABJF10_30005 [Chthoniobacter sp.]|uniref:hypothetical protein n=1 Tax=Chthoniobacter sp. TaxID=2510640 RepID=UPI0032AC0A52